ncbi:hypothetical protein CBR_g37735 [Chara braunii]|uniref:Uncharacterized protein n=1 Tax=Chara braunii TaxID=69332 RepID=A0A388K022_CHABU|nr:hypothetical protein CBR_g37735 [Chara braunii]|eukprot:GBG63377.1 hypothetical protein CBR_g37735 [Chara braunii]
MYGRGRGGKAGNRRGRWSNCGRYWMDANSRMGQQPSAASTFQHGGGLQNGPAPPGTAPQQQYVMPIGQGPVGQVPHGMPATMAAMAAMPAVSAMPTMPTMPTMTIPMMQPMQMPAANNFVPMPGGQWGMQAWPDTSENVIDVAKKKLASGRRGGIRISEITEENSRSEVRSNEKGEEMKVWVTETLGDSLKLIMQKLEEVDSKAKLAAAERMELLRLREEKASLDKEKRDGSSSEKRKRGGNRIAMVTTPKEIVVKTRTCGSAKGRPKRIEISSDDDGAAGGVKQDLSVKMENSSQLSEVKKLLEVLVHGLADQKGKQPAQAENPAMQATAQATAAAAAATAKAVEAEEAANNMEDVNIVQNDHVDEDDEEADEGGLAAYMKMRQIFYSSLHYTRVIELCKQKEILYFRKEMGAWELARLDLQEYADQLKGNMSGKGGDPSRRRNERNSDNDDEGSAAGDGPIAGN